MVGNGGKKGGGVEEWEKEEDKVGWLVGLVLSGHNSLKGGGGNNTHSYLNKFLIYACITYL